MRALLLLVALASGAWGQGVHNPHAADGLLLKGQLHCHSDASDGAQSPQAVFAAYAAAGYDFVALSDHLVVSADPGVPGVTWIPASEVHTAAADGSRWTGHHVNVLGLPREPTAGWARGDLSALLAQVDAAGGLSMANHPRVRHRWSPAELTDAGPLSLVSIYNAKGHARVNARLAGAGDLLFATAWHWDRALTAGRRLWGVAADDCHDVTDPGQFDAGWVRVRARSRRAEDVVAALRAGDVYACRGPAGDAPALAVRAWRDDAGWHVGARSPTPGVELRWIAAGQVLARGEGPDLTLRIPAGATYLRAEAHQGPQRVTYAQPLWVEPTEELPR